MLSLPDGTHHTICDLLLIASVGAEFRPWIAWRVSNLSYLASNFVRSAGPAAAQSTSKSSGSARLRVARRGALRT